MSRPIEIFISFFMVILLFPLLLTCWVLASIDTKSNGLYSQNRIGRNGKLFKLYKVKTMRDSNSELSTVAELNRSRITRTGYFFRKTKIDELPQLINILFGQMSFVGPRPDVPGYADKLNAEESFLLNERPGVTGAATLYFRYEEEILSATKDPQGFNDNVIFPLKVRINLSYLKERNFLSDIDLLCQTFFSFSIIGKKIEAFKSPEDCLNYRDTLSDK